MNWLRKCGLSAVVLGALSGAVGCGHSYNEVIASNPANAQDRGFVAKKVTVDGTERNYAVFIPHNYTPSKQWPVIVFLHGALEGGSDGRSQMTVGLGPAIAKMAGNFGFITVFPQSPGDWKGEDRGRIAIACLDQVQQQYSTDRSCVTLTGLSNGGEGTWVVGGRYPERFSALVPMCGYSAYDSVPSVARIPTWIFHNSGDFLVGCGNSDEMHNRVKAAGGNIKFTRIDAGGHNLREGGIQRELAPGVNARIFPGVNAMLSVVTLEPGSVSPVHSHPNEQWGVCLEGEWIRIQDGVEHHVKAGDFWQTPPNVPHGGRTGATRAVVLDIFSPPREEYRTAGKGLGV